MDKKRTIIKLDTYAVISLALDGLQYGDPVVLSLAKAAADAMERTHGVKADRPQCFCCGNELTSGLISHGILVHIQSLEAESDARGGGSCGIVCAVCAHRADWFERVKGVVASMDESAKFLGVSPSTPSHH